MLRAAALFTISLLGLPFASSEPAPADNNIAQQYSPFIPPSTRNRAILLFKRQSCPSGYNSCSNLGEPGACCPTDTNCARDQSGNIACCPVNNYCTGVVGSAAASSGATTQSSSGTTAFVGTMTVTSTAGVTGTPQATTASITGGAAGGGSTITDGYYPFVYVPTSFANAAVCSQYYTSCQTASSSCFQSLAGAFGVTIGGVAGGTTQAGSSGLLQASASSICSSLSQRACLGLQSSQCSQYGTGGATGSGFVQAGKGPRETGHPAMIYMAAAGVAVGAMGLVA